MKNFCRYALTLAVIIILWQCAAIAFGPNILPKPAIVLQSLMREISGAEFWLHARASFSRAVGGVLIGFAAAFPFGLWLGGSPKADAWLSPFIFLTYPIPKILLLPVLLVLLGLGEAPKYILIALTCGYQILVVTRDSARNIDPGYLASFKAIRPQSKGRRPLELACHVLAPACLPAAVSALRLATGTAVAVLFMAESFVTDRGLGFMIMDAWGGLDLPRMFSGIAAMSLMGFLLYGLTNLIERRVCRWLEMR
ncbi:ABC transporter permease subunit [Deltaproteobacteria bacterium OttesenSCG-928-K17]|nr:ABC transporter permease subunit [Deltaproteobacteria bacterium OttesenSCG-928-K17]